MWSMAYIYIYIYHTEYCELCCLLTQQKNASQDENADFIYNKINYIIKYII